MRVPGRLVGGEVVHETELYLVKRAGRESVMVRVSRCNPMRFIARASWVLLEGGEITCRSCLFDAHRSRAREEELEA